MIFKNFFYFIAAIMIWSIAPDEGTGLYSPALCFYGLLLSILIFWHLNRYFFLKLRAALNSETMPLYEGKRRYLQYTDVHTIIAIALFTVESFAFDLKRFTIGLSPLGTVDTFINAAGLAIFIFHLAIVWYWAYRSVGDKISIGSSSSQYIKSNIKFNLAIIISWLFFLLLHDVVTLLSPSLASQIDNSFVIQVLFFVIFLALFSIFAPVFICRLWDCKPLGDLELKERLESFCRAQGVKFKGIMSWNALNGGLMTAGVIGLVSSFRYLMITPELIKLLDDDELLGVVCHEVGHVKKKHLLYYLIFFLGLVVAMSLIQWSVFSGVLILVLPQRMVDYNILSYINLVLPFFIIVIYFRFIIGYFMRNFEREADMFCFESGVDPNHLITSFMKLGVQMEDYGKKSNWHHYNIPQRIDFLRACMENPGIITTHKKRVRRSLRIFMAILLMGVGLFIFAPSNLNYHFAEIILKQRIEKNPGDSESYSLLGMIYYEGEKWKEAKKAYEKSLQLEYDQPEVLNNLAWLLLKCPDKKLLDPGRALNLARDAAGLNRSTHILDTLAEAYFQNAMYKEAAAVSQKALSTAKENIPYYKEQYRKMLRYYRSARKSIKI